MAQRVTLQHVGIVTSDVDRLTRFYRDVIGLELFAASEAQSEHMVPFRWLRLGDHELHVVQRDPRLAERLNVSINPSVQPHFAVRVDDIEALKRRLDANGVEWIDWGHIGIRGLNQIFMRDADGNVVEFEQF